jgi:hypothetical protein
MACPASTLTGRLRALDAFMLDDANALVERARIAADLIRGTGET